MPLPPNDILWPPQSIAGPAAKMAEWAAWYSGEPTRIIDAYSATAPGGQTPWWRFWSRARAGAVENAQRAQLHVPIASDLAAVSGALLFGEPPKIRVRPAPEEPEVEDTTDAAPADPLTGAPAEPPKPKKKPTTLEEKAEARILELVEWGDINARLVEAAESAAAIGGVYIYPVWDMNFRDYPMMAVAQADNAIPEFRFGFLSAVTFHHVIATSGVQVWRHIERHEIEGTGESRKCVVYNGLYLGNEHSLGTQVSLTSRPETANIMPKVTMPFSDLDVEYLPNIRPNRLWRNSGLGVADIQGAESLLDALDETYASWMRDVRLAKARIIVPREYLRPDEAGKAAFDIDQEIYVPMDMEPGLSQDSRAMMAHQFGIRYQEHRETAKDLVERIVSNAGYVPTTLGTGSASGATASALRVSEHKTLLTLRKKSGWWRTAIANVIYHMLLIDAEIFKSGVEAIRPTVMTSDSIIDNPLELAQTALALKTAESASVETRVRLVHPDWSSAEIDAEVEKITGEKEAAKPPTPVMGGGAFGDPTKDPADTKNVPVTEQPSGPAPTNAPPPQATKKA